MDKQEMSRIVAEKVMGWPIGDYWEYKQPHPVIEDCGQVLYLIVGCKSVEYDPATNVAQAIEAAEVWRKKNSNTFWDVCSPLDDEGWDCTIYVRDFPAEGIHAVADTPALAITEALVNAVSDE